MKIHKGDTVKVIAGVHKGQVGKVLKTYPDKGRLIVEKVNIIKRHTKPTQQLPQGGIVEREAAISASNVMVLDPKTDEPTRIGTKVLANGKRARVAKKSGEMLARSDD